MAQMVKCLPTMQDTRVQSLGREDLLEKEMAIHSSILAWKIPWTRNLVGYSPRGCKESGTTESLHFTSLHMLAKKCSKFSKQEYWSGLPFPSPGDLPDPGIEPRSLALQADSLPTELQGKLSSGK